MLIWMLGMYVTGFTLKNAVENVLFECEST